MSITEFLGSLDPMALGFLAGSLAMLWAIGLVLFQDIDLGSPSPRPDTPSDEGPSGRDQPDAGGKPPSLDEKPPHRPNAPPRRRAA